METMNDTNRVWKRPLGCLLWILVFFLCIPIFLGLIALILLPFTGIFSSL